MQRIVWIKAVYPVEVVRKGKRQSESLLVTEPMAFSLQVLDPAEAPVAARMNPLSGGELRVVDGRVAVQKPHFSEDALAKFEHKYSDPENWWGRGAEGLLDFSSLMSPAGRAPFGHLGKPVEREAAFQSVRSVLHDGRADALAIIAEGERRLSVVGDALYDSAHEPTWVVALTHSVESGHQVQVGISSDPVVQNVLPHIRMRLDRADEVATVADALKRRLGSENRIRGRDLVGRTGHTVGLQTVDPTAFSYDEEEGLAKTVFTRALRLATADGFSELPSAILSRWAEFRGLVEAHEVGEPADVARAHELMIGMQSRLASIPAHDERRTKHHAVRRLEADLVSYLALLDAHRELVPQADDEALLGMG